jgi:hypothetical protein
VFFSFPSVRRGAAFALLAALAAGCSTNGVAPSSPSNATGAAQSTSSSANRALANGRNVHQQPARIAGGWISPDAKHKKGKKLFYWGNFDNNTITIYSSKGVNGKEEGQITTGLSEPERLFVDKQLNVYATNPGNNTITAYKPGTTSPSLTISNGVDTPTGLTVDAGGTVYCANVGNDSITEYPKGDTTPSVTISGLPSSPEYLATDAQDNLYASVGSEVMEFAKGSTTGKNLGLVIGFPEAIEVDHSGNLIVLDGSNDDIDVFPAGQTQPSKQVTVTSGLPFALSLSKNEKQLYVSVDASNTFIVQQLAYPNGTTLSNKLTTGAGDWPIAVSPDNALGS